MSNPWAHIPADGILQRMQSPVLGRLGARLPIAAGLSLLLHSGAILPLILVLHLKPAMSPAAEVEVEMVFAPPPAYPAPQPAPPEPTPAPPTIPDIVPAPVPDAALSHSTDSAPPIPIPLLPEAPTAPPPGRPPPVPRPTLRKPISPGAPARRTSSGAPARRARVRPNAAAQGAELPAPSPPAPADAPGAVPSPSRLIPPSAVAGQQTVQPVYPKSARRRNEQGDVLVRVSVGADGLPISVSIFRSSGSRTLDEAAAAAVRGWHFRPATRNGMPVAASAEVPIRFRLTN